MTQQKPQSGPYVLRRIYQPNAQAPEFITRTQTIDIPSRVVFKHERFFEDIDEKDEGGNCHVGKGRQVLRNVRIGTAFSKTRKTGGEDKTDKPALYFAHPSNYLRKTLRTSDKSKEPLNKSRAQHSSSQKTLREINITNKNILSTNRSFMKQFLATKLHMIRSQRRDNYFQYLYNCATNVNASPSEA